MFEDASATPPAIHLLMDMTNRELPEVDDGSEFKFEAISSDGVEFRARGFYRLVDTLPCLLPLDTKSGLAG